METYRAFSVQKQESLRVQDEGRSVQLFTPNIVTHLSVDQVYDLIMWLSEWFREQGEKEGLPKE